MLKPNDQGKRFRKYRKGNVSDSVKAGHYISYGFVALKSLTAFRITAQQIESARKAAVRQMDRKGKLFIRVFPHFTITSKPIGVRMGSGKGSIDKYVDKVSPGRILFEIDGVSPDIAKEALRLAAAKLPCKSTIVFDVDHSKVIQDNNFATLN